MRAQTTFAIWGKTLSWRSGFRTGEYDSQWAVA